MIVSVDWLSTANGGLKLEEIGERESRRRTFYRQWRSETEAPDRRPNTTWLLSTANGGLKPVKITDVANLLAGFLPPMAV